MKLLQIAPRLGKDAAIRYAINLCKALKLQVSAKAIMSTIINLDDGKKIVLNDEIIYIMENGKADYLQILHDAADRYLNTPLTMGAWWSCGGINAKITSTYGNHTTAINAPGIIEAPENSLANDITYFRIEAVRCYNEQNISGFSRAYRGYLQSCISLVDCFLHRYTFHVKSIIPDTGAYTNTAALDSMKSIDERIEAWVTTFATHHRGEIKQTGEYSKFQELRRERNKIVHPNVPSVAYEFKSIVKYLNFANDGIGGLLSKLREYSEQTANIGFIRQIKTEPQIISKKK